MEVYMLESDPDEWAGLYTAHGELDRFEPFDGSPIAAGWEPVEVAWADLEGRRGRADFCSVGVAPTFTARAVEALGDLLEGRGELLPLTVVGGGGGGGGEAYAFNITRISDALERDRSEYDYYDDGGVMSIERYVFDPARVAEETIFKLPIRPKGFKYVTDRFRDRVERAGLTGFRWKAPVWTGQLG